MRIYFSAPGYSLQNLVVLLFIVSCLGLAKVQANNAFATGQIRRSEEGGVFLVNYGMKVQVNQFPGSNGLAIEVVDGQNDWSVVLDKSRDTHDENVFRFATSNHRDQQQSKWAIGFLSYRRRWFIKDESSGLLHFVNVAEWDEANNKITTISIMGHSYNECANIKRPSAPDTRELNGPLYVFSYDVHRFTLETILTLCFLDLYGMMPLLLDVPEAAAWPKILPPVLDVSDNEHSPELNKARLIGSSPSSSRQMNHEEPSFVAAGVLSTTSSIDYATSAALPEINEEVPTRGPLHPNSLLTGYIKNMKQKARDSFIDANFEKGTPASVVKGIMAPFDRSVERLEEELIDETAAMWAIVPIHREMNTFHGALPVNNPPQRIPTRAPGSGSSRSLNMSPTEIEDNVNKCKTRLIADTGYFDDVHVTAAYLLSDILQVSSSDEEGIKYGIKKARQILHPDRLINAYRVANDLKEPSERMIKIWTRISQELNSITQIENPNDILFALALSEAKRKWPTSNDELWSAVFHHIPGYKAYLVDAWERDPLSVLPPIFFITMKMALDYIVTDDLLESEQDVYNQILARCLDISSFHESYITRKGTNPPKELTKYWEDARVYFNRMSKMLTIFSTHIQPGHRKEFLDILNQNFPMAFTYIDIDPSVTFLTFLCRKFSGPHESVKLKDEIRQLKDFMDSCNRRLEQFYASVGFMIKKTTPYAKMGYDAAKSYYDSAINSEFAKRAWEKINQSYEYAKNNEHVKTTMAAVQSNAQKCASFVCDFVRRYWPKKD